MTDGHRDNSVGERKLIWDEENRLLAVDDNGFVSNYWYDADGERTVKTSGESDQVYVNGVFSGGSTNTAKFSLYVSPYLVANQGGRYTKHIYAGSQRIVSKVGDFASYGSDPRRIEYAGANTDGLSVDYKSKYAAQQQVIKDNYKFFDVPYNGTDNDNYADGEGFCCNDGSMEAAVAEARKAQTRAVSRSFKDPDNYENLQFFYHPDHLGSSSFITNLDGEVVQHIEYVPFGEVFIEERNNVWNTPYLFNAKEFDEETGMYYYGARYYDPRLALWISTDPLQGMKPNMSSYSFSSNNPVNYIDPDGRADFMDENKVIGNDGKNDGKLFVLKTDKTEFSNNNYSVPASGLSKQARNSAKKFVKDNSGNSEAFDNNSSIYDNFVEIQGSSDIRKAMVDEISKDNGKRGTKPSNNREYGGIIRDGKVVVEAPGDVSNPQHNTNASIQLTDGFPSFHSHPSGEVIIRSMTENNSSTIVFGSQGTTTIYQFEQFPSPQDISGAGNSINYVFGRRDGNVYIYSKNGVEAVVPMKSFLSPKK